jgi:hypothetical protein
MSHDLRGFQGTKRYVPRRLLGAGGMGVVYEVDDRTTGGRVALKMMLDDDAGRLLRFKQEFRVMAELHHPNLVRLFDLGQHDGRWFFTMELVHGEGLLEVLLPEGAPSAETATEPAVAAAVAGATLDGRAAQRASGEDAPARRRCAACDPEALIRIVAQILDALEFLHGQGIVHRDLKPSNILVDLEGIVRVLDFGLASRLDRTAAISHEGAVVGTLAYLSPEQYRGGSASAASDLYAVGVMMFQLLTGELPFQGTPSDALAARAERPPPRADERVLDAPPALCEVIHRLMAVDPALRASIEDVRAALGLGRHPALPAPARGAGEELFIGRQRELAILGGCLERAADGQAQLVLASGPSGIGKSALAAMMIRRAERLGFSCFGGRCYEREQVPFVAFDRVMDAMTLALRSWPAARLDALRPSLLVLQRIFPALGVLTGVPRFEASGADPRALHRQALDSFRELCRRCQVEAPLCFVLDDLQWADEESIALLSEVLVGGPGRIMVLGLLRPEGVDAHHPLDRLLRRVRGSDAVVSLPIAALPASDARQIVETATAGRLDPRMSDALATQADGNPFLLLRLCEHLALLAPGQQARLDAVGSADDLVRRMIATLTPRAEQVLALAATAGGDIAAPLLRDTSALRGEDFDLAVGELTAARLFKAVRAGVTAEVAEGAPPALRFDLYHDRIREVAYQGLAAERRRALHRSLAVAIEAQPEGDARDVEGLVRHWGQAGDRDRQRRYAAIAAEQAAKKLAFVRAARLFRIVLEDPGPEIDPLAAAARWERVGDLFEYGGLRLDAARAYQEAQRRWDEARDDHPDRAAARLRLRGLAGVNLMATKHVAEGRCAFESGLALLGRPLDRPLPQQLAVLAGLKARAVLAERLDDLRARAGVRQELRRAAHRPGPGEQLLAAEVWFLDLLVLAFEPLWIGPAAEAALRSELLGRRVEDRRVRLRSLASGAAVPVFLGRCSPDQLERAHRRLDAADALVRAHDIAPGRELVQLSRSLLWMATNMARARATCEAALEGFARRGLTDSLDGEVARAYYLYILSFKGDDDDALGAIERELGAPRPNSITVAIFLGEQVVVLARRGRCAEAREALGRLDAHLAGQPASRLDLLSVRGLAAVLFAEGRFAEVLALRATARPLERASGVAAFGLHRSVVLELELEAALGVLRQHGLSWRARRALRRDAAWLAARGVFDFSCLGHRALALLDHAEGRPRAASLALSSALALSSTNTSPRHRWLCLEAARDLGVITLDQEDEAAALAEAGHFGLPPGWSITRS